MPDSNPEVHLHFDIPSNFHGTLVVDPGTGAVTITGLSDVGATPTGSGQLLSDYREGAVAEPMVLRHEKNGRKGTRSREMAVALLSRGWTPKLGPKYLRWIYQGDDHKVTLYQNSKDILSRDDRHFMESVEGANPTKNEVRWRYDTDLFDVALKSIETIEIWADGKPAAA